MKKIKRFKIPQNYREINRRVCKSGIDLTSAGLSGDASITEFASVLMSCAEPSAVFDTFENDSLSLAGTDAKKGALFSAGIISLGKDLDDKINSLDMPAQNAADIIALAFLDSSFSFICDLIKEEAEKENFILSPAELVYSPQTDNCAGKETLIPLFIRKNRIADKETAKDKLNNICALLTGEKIGFISDDNGTSPRYSICFILPWDKKRKKK